MINCQEVVHNEGSGNRSYQGIEMLEPDNAGQHVFGFSGPVSGTRVPDRSVAPAGYRGAVVEGRRFFQNGTDIQTAALEDELLVLDQVGAARLPAGAESGMQKTAAVAPDSAASGAPASGDFAELCRRMDELSTRLGTLSGEPAQGDDTPVQSPPTVTSNSHTRVVTLQTPAGGFRAKCVEVINTGSFYVLCYDLAESSFAPTPGTEVVLGWGGLAVRTEATGLNFEVLSLQRGFLVFKGLDAPEQELSEDALLQNVERAATGLRDAIGAKDTSEIVGE